MPNAMKKIFEWALFSSRWLIAPFYLGLVLALAELLVVFLRELLERVPDFWEMSVSTTTLWVLSLIDLSLVGNLVLIVILAGYKNFVARMDAQDHPDWPSWLATVGFSGMKLKLMGSIAAISSIYLLEKFLKPEKLDPANIVWLLAIQGVILLSGILLALTDYIEKKSGGEH
jgi:uncharacterized protein (TIGR00645 family)